MAKNEKNDAFLKFLKFDPKLGNGLIAKFLSNPRYVILLLILVLVLGISSYFSLPRDLNPQIKIPIVLVTDVLPGASPSDIESLITKPIEDSVDSLEHIKTIKSNSQDNVSVVQIEFESGTDPEKAKSDVQSAVDAVNLPGDAQRPRVIKLDFQNSPVWVFNLTTTNDEGTLFKFATNLQQKLKDLPEIDKVEINGLEEREIQITINPQTYATYGVSPLQLTQLISSALKSYPAGSVKTTGGLFSIAIDAQVTTIDDIRNLRLLINNKSVSLADIATITERPKPDQGQSFLAYPKKPIQHSVTFNVFRTSTVNIDKAVQVAEKEVNNEINLNKQSRMQAITLINTSSEIDKQFGELAKDFAITIILVVLVLFIFLGPRQAIVSAFSAPLSFLIAFIVMNMTGITLNFLSLFSLILALGLLVDDTVVVISAMTFYYKTKRFTPLETGLLVWRDFIVPVFTTTITTVWAFLPLLLSTGIIGEFIKSIPIVVSTSLAASFFVSIFITLPLMIILLKPNVPRRVSVLIEVLILITLVISAVIFLPKGKLYLIELVTLLIVVAVGFYVRSDIFSTSKKTVKRILMRRKGRTPRGVSIPLVRYLREKNLDEGVIGFETINYRYKRLIEGIIRKKNTRRMVISMVIIFSLFSFLLLPFGFVKNEFFPKTDEDVIYITAEYPAGTNIEQTKKEALAVLDSLKNTSGIKYVSANLGQTLSQTGGGSASGGQNNVLFVLNLFDKKERKKPSIDVAQDIRDNYKNYQKGKLSVIEVSGGPPAGADVQIKLLGDDLDVLNKYADKIEKYLKTVPGVTNIDKSIKPGTSKIAFVPDKSLLAQNQIPVDQMGLWLRLYASGFNFAKNKFPGDTADKDITLRLSPDVLEVESIDQLMIPTKDSNIPLSSLGHFELEQNPTLITREDGKRTISVSATVTKGNSIISVNKKLEQFANSKLQLPQGYAWKTGGVNEENQNSVNSILQAMVISFLLIIATMVIQFASFRRAIIVMLVIPLSISGVFIIFALTKTPLSFPALIGVLALFGIVVKNSILIVDKIVQNQKHGLPMVEAIGEASASRLEPIALTSFAAILGLLPITLTDPLWRGLGGAIISGLTFSGIIMLFFIPVVYYMFFPESKKQV